MIEIELIALDTTRETVKVKESSPWFYKGGRWFGFSHKLKGKPAMYYQPKEVTAELKKRADKEGTVIL